MPPVDGGVFFADGVINNYLHGGRRWYLIKQSPLASLLGLCTDVGVRKWWRREVAHVRYAGLFQENIEMKSVEKKSEKGASLVEYALLVALIAVVAIAAVRILGTNASAQFSTIAAQIQG